MSEIINDYILDSVKLALGGNLVSSSSDAFDQQLLMHINSTFTILNQFGVGPKEPFVANKTSRWDEFLVEDSANLRLVQSYVFLRVRLMYDPPSSSFVMDSIKEQIKEFEWRLNIFVDPGSSIST